MSEVNYSARKPIQPLFPYVDRHVENILTEVDRKLRGTGISVQSIQPYIFEDELQSQRLSLEEKAIISNKIDRLVNHYTSPSIHHEESGMMRAKHKQLLYFKSKEVEIKSVEKDSEHKFQKMIMSYRNDLEKIYSNRYTAEPAFCYNHFVNHDIPIQIKDHIGVRALNIYLWNFDFQTALYCLSCNSSEHPDRMDTELLRTVIRIFQNIKIIIQRDPELVKKVYYRKGSDFLALEEERKEEEKYVSIPFTLLLGDISETDLKAVSSLPTGMKMYLLKKCMDYAIDLAREMAEIAKHETDKKNSCYIPYLFLSNDLETPNYGLILENPHLKEVDKFFFAFKFLKNTKFQQYKLKLERRLEVSSDLLELGLCNTIKSQSKIMQNYIDETGDIKTIAILSLYEKIKIGFDKPCDLDIFIEKYKNILVEFNQQSKLEDFKNKQKELRQKNRLSGGTNSRKESSQSMEIFQIGDTFLSRIDLETKKLKASLPRKDYVKFFCWICRTNAQEFEIKSKILAQDSYAECQKCLHGGHLKHLNIWFEDNIRCPVPDCSCCCN